ncbi:ABC transporter substrate-binding protein [Micromonospora sagamiensis]|uniref:Amino acid/amide ABC transporter substrate-binding protein, HAAT family (TC 3.A.1.4.-) n=1 Tax=Micromonospora sagamiensis TaxID=47875 RepID=A0A562WPB8_9ACTN|nr:ABC transporter substrate-binding protein [Micromonospora sagamiensis]TWJ32139.1 amino acid/amide ABC transporter substrate-binding protein, HAAT family (TC 3.A.1.4.-) [Micromonospora sagamiensis]BCL14802.1 branched chain amino acid ABC transporter substrate-binding protein [Micromonospora sagamiensis]
MNRRRVLQLLAATVGTTGLTAACGTDMGDDTPEAGSPIKIGLIAPRAGGYKPIGDELLNGFQLFLDLNDQHLGNRPVTLLTADEGENAASGKAAVDNLLQQGVLALTGVVNSSVMVGIRDTVEQARVPLVGSDASPATLQSVVYIWRTSYVLDEPGRALGGYLRQQMPAGSRVVIIAPENVGSLDVVKGFRQEFGASDPRLVGEPIWTRFSTDPGGDYFRADIQQALARDPDAIFCFYAGSAAVQFIRQLRGAGYRGPVYAPGFLTEGSVLSEIKPAEAANIMTSLNYSADLNNAANRRFAAAYRKKHNASPTTYAMASYDAAQVLDKAIRLAGPNANSQQVNLALGKVGQIDSPRGSWQFNQPRTPQQRWYLRRVQLDGQVLANMLVTELATLG